jgi:hypothetical protein
LLLLHHVSRKGHPLQLSRHESPRRGTCGGIELLRILTLAHEHTLLLQLYMVLLLLLYRVGLDIISLAWRWNWAATKHRDCGICSINVLWHAHWVLWLTEMSRILHEGRIAQSKHIGGLGDTRAKHVRATGTVHMWIF